MAANEMGRPSVIAVTAFSILVLARSSQAISCETSASLNGVEANVTCMFDRNVNVTKNAFTVVHHSFDAGTDTPGTDVAVCVWVPKKPAFECSLRDGYRLEEGSISQNVTVRVASLTASTEGRYACHLVPPQGDSGVTLCQLNLTGKTTELSTTTTTLVTTYEVINSTAEGLNQTHPQPDLLPIIISCSLGGGVLVASVVIVCWLCRRSQRKPGAKERVRVEYIRPSMEPRLLEDEVILLPHGPSPAPPNGLGSTKHPELGASEKLPSAAPPGTNSSPQALCSSTEEAKPLLSSPADKEGSLIPATSPAETAKTDSRPLDTVDQGTSPTADDVESSVRSNRADDEEAPLLLPRRPTLKSKDSDPLGTVVPPLHREFSIKSEKDPEWRRANVENTRPAAATVVRPEASRPTAHGDVARTYAAERLARPTSVKQHDEYTVAIETLRSMLKET